MLVRSLPNNATSKVVPPNTRPPKPVTLWFAEWKVRKAEAATAAKALPSPG